MKTLSSSPESGHWSKKKLLERRAREGLTIDNDSYTKALADLYDSMRSQSRQHEQDPVWQQNNLEYDLRTCDWIAEKVRRRKDYAQNLYAAMCNNRFQRHHVWNVLADQIWSCSWRYAGGIVADLCQEGDYLDWYCSGIQDRDPPTDQEESEWTQQQKLLWETEYKNYVSESTVTDEIRSDLFVLGWNVVDQDQR